MDGSCAGISAPRRCDRRKQVRALSLASRLARFNRGVINPVMRPLAGHVPGMALVVHVGRRSGRRYQTPVLVLRHAGTFHVMVLSARVPDWMRNLQAAGGGELRMGGQRVNIGPPTVTEAADALEAASAIGRRLRRGLGTRSIYVRLESPTKSQDHR